MRIAGHNPYIYVIIQKVEETFELHEVQFYSKNMFGFQHGTERKMS